jgi:mRNA-degrading endonuclease RelE of RelBE toxin-antitoxin system
MAKGVNTYQVSRRFKKEYNGLPKEIQKAFDQKLQVFLKDMAHPSLRVKRIQGTRDRWEGSVTMKYRFTFEFSEGILIFRAIGTHDIIIKESQ